MNGTNINVGNVQRCCKELNTARRNILSNLNRIKTCYGFYGLDQWSGASRQKFHEEVFGIDGNSGLVGVLGSGEKGICKALNDLLYILANYVTNVANKDSEYMSNYDPLRPEFFIDASVEVAQVTAWIEYDQIDPNDVRLNLDTVETFVSKIDEFCENIKNETINFSNSLEKLISEGISDYTTDNLDYVASLLKVKIEDFRTRISALLKDNVNTASFASQSAQQTASQNQEIANIVSKLDFD